MLAFSFSYINEGHEVNHYRDGIAGQLWGRAGVWNRNLVFGLGVGPYAFFDTHGGANGAFHDEHGVAALFSATATLYALSPLLFQARINYLAARQSFNTLSGTIGIGYELGTDKTPTGKPAGQGVGALQQRDYRVHGGNGPQHPEERTGHFLGLRVPAESCHLPRLDGHGALGRSRPACGPIRPYEPGLADPSVLHGSPDARCGLRSLSGTR